MSKVVVAIFLTAAMANAMLEYPVPLPASWHHVVGGAQ